MIKQRILLFIPMMFVGSLAFAAGKAEVRLTLDERFLLPGTPTGISIVVANRGDEELQLPPSLWIVATDQTGKTFVVHSHSLFHDTAGQELVPENLRALAPGASPELRFDPSIAVAGSPWFMDDRLWTPGRYRLRAIFALNVTPDGTFDPGIALISNEEALTVGAETVEDAAVWRWMQEHRWNEQEWLSPGRLADFVMKQHPLSQYALFVALYLPRHNEGPAPAVLDLVKRYPNRSFTEQVKLLLMQNYEQAESLARHQSNMYVAATESDDARAIASELMRNSRSSNVRAFAKELLDRIPTREQLLKKPETH